MTWVIFWDIDGTLLSTARAGIYAVEAAAREVLGTDVDLSELHTSGLTDHQVMEAAIRHVGHQLPPDEVRRMLEIYEALLPDNLPLRQGAVMPGVREILEDLAPRPDVESLLLTGNTAGGAAAKLEHYGIDQFFDAGAFCADGGPREDIARRAWDLAAERADGPLDAGHVFVVGDTPHDVRAGDAIGARTVAVATGAYGVEDLEEAGAWLVLERLPDPERFRALLDIGA